MTEEDLNGKNGTFINPKRAVELMLDRIRVQEAARDPKITNPLE